MKHQSVASLLRYVAVAAFLLVSSFSYSQVLTPRPTSVSGTCGGYYEYLPQGYSTNTGQSYPLIVAVHGIGEIGNGTTDLGNLLNCWTAIPRLIANGAFPTSFNVGGQNFSFIVIAPQFNQWPYASDVNAVVDYAVSHYRVDQSRIYVTGLSMGGGSVWDFAGNYPTKAAAVVPVCGAASSDPTRAQAIANAKLPVWATHNQNDPTVSVSNTTGWVSLIGQYGWNIQSTIFNASGHDAWTQTYDPNFTQNGVNVYQWMLMHQKGTSSTPPPPSPTVAATVSTLVSSTSTTRIEAENYSNMYGVQKESTTDAGGGQDVGYIDYGDWMDYSVNVSSAGTYAVNLRLASPTGGQLQIKDASGSVLATVSVPNTGGYQNWQTVSTNIALPAGTQTIRIYSTSNGWNINWWEIAGSTTSSTSSLSLTTSSTTTTHIEAENYANMYGVVKEGTSDVGGGQDVGYIDYGDWMDYSVNVSSAGTYAVNLRLASPSGGQLQIKDASGTVLATVSVPNTGGYQNWQTVSTNIALPAGTQTIRIYSTSNGWNINWWEIAGAGSGAAATTSGSGGTTHIEAENYANMYGVVKEGTSDVGGGQDVGYIDYGDWMDYSVNVSSTGTYAVNLRLASPSGGQLQIKDASGTVLATVSVPNTGGYQNWQTVSTNIALPAGTQTIRIYSTSNGWNINWWEIAGAGSGAAATTSGSGGTTHIEAENYANMYGVVKEGTSDVNGGQDVGYIDYGDWMDYNVNVSAAGTYSVNLRVASPTGGQLQIKNSAGTVLATVSVPATGGWQTWQTVTASISLSAGSQTIRVYSTSNGWNFNWWEISGGSGTVSAASVSKAEVVSSSTLSATPVLSIYPNPIVDRFQLQVNNDLTGSVKVQVYDMQGNLQKQFALSKADAGTSQFYLSIGQLPAATYLVKVTMSGWTDSKQVIKK